MEWLKNLSSAIKYIEDNLSGDISVDEASKIACCSAFYFQRMFTHIAGIPLSEYIRRRRMTMAAFDIKAGKMKVMDIGFKYGYGSPTAFNRAFRSVHGVSPSDAKHNGTALKSYPPIRIAVSVTGTEEIKYSIEHKNAMKIIGIRTELKNDMEENQRIVPVFWEKVINEGSLENILGLDNGLTGKLFGVTACNKTGEAYYYIGAEDKDLHEYCNLYELTIPAASWVVFKCEKPFKESVQIVFKHFLTEWLPFSGYEYAELPDIEVYPADNENEHAEVWIGIKKEEVK